MFSGWTGLADLIDAAPWWATVALGLFELEFVVWALAGCMGVHVPWESAFRGRR
jgi:hypothetical protein